MSVILSRWLVALDKRPADRVNLKRGLRRRRNPAALRAKWKAYRAANAERIRETARRFRERNREQIRLYDRAYRARRAA